MDQELVQYLDERFGRIEQRLDGHDRRFDEVNDRIEEVKRHSGVLVEGLRHELHLVAEGLTMHIQVQHVQEREYHDRQHQETRALLRSFYDELRQRDDQLGQQQDQLHQRVENLERNKLN
jgi:thymidylate synthase